MSNVEPQKWRQQLSTVQISRRARNVALISLNLPMQNNPMTDQVDDCHWPSINAVTTPIAYCPERGNGTEHRVGRVFAANPVL
jgi:hypothetical protein